MLAFFMCKLQMYKHTSAKTVFIPYIPYIFYDVQVNFIIFTNSIIHITSYFNL